MPLAKDYTLKFLVLWPVFFSHLILLRLVWSEVKRRPWTQERQGWILGLCALNPALLLDGPVWGQVDIVPAVFAVLAIAGLARRSALTLWSPAFLVLALLCKFQMIAILPVYAGLALYRWRWLLRALPIGIAVGALIVLPWILFDSVSGLIDKAYLNNTSMYPYATYNAANIWMSLVGNVAPDNQLLFQGTKEATETWQFILTPKGLGMVAFSLFSLFTFWKSWRVRKPRQAWKWSALILFAFFILLPGMHERYLLPAVPFVVLAWATDIRRGFLFLVITLVCALNIAQVNGLNGEWLWMPLSLFGVVVFFLMVGKEVLGGGFLRRIRQAFVALPAPIWLPEGILILSLSGMLIYQAIPPPSFELNLGENQLLLTSIPPLNMQPESRKFNINRSYDNQPLQVNGRVFKDGIGTHAPSSFSFPLPMNSDSLYVMIGIDDEAKQGKVEFIIWVDGVQKWTSEPANGGEEYQLAMVSVAHGRILTLETRTLGPDSYDHADWLQPVIILDKTVRKLDSSLRNPTLSSQDYKQPAMNSSVDGNPLSVNGKMWDLGWGAHANSRMEFSIPDTAKSFAVNFGIDDESPGGEVQFRIELDGVQAWKSDTIRHGSPTGFTRIPLQGEGKLALVIDGLGSINYDHADWLEPQFQAQE
jgi:hypothetical protein